MFVAYFLGIMRCCSSFQSWEEEQVFGEKASLREEKETSVPTDSEHCEE